jgi:serine/threonine-protein kinase
VEFIVPIEVAKARFPDFEFVEALTPSAQKAAFHVRRSGKDYCLKIIAPTQTLERVQREVLAMQALDHPNIVKVVEYEYSVKDGEASHYIVEEFIAGDDLSAHMTPGRGWSIDKIVEIFGPLCDGLAALEAAKIVHRDLKPSNVRIRSDNSPVIVDFGLARVLDMSSITATVDGAMFGTPRYFAPEQLRGTKHDIDHRTDLYALGVLIYEAAVGHHPTLRKSVQTFSELFDAICNCKSYLEDKTFKLLPQRLQLLVGRLLEKERAKRPNNAVIVGKILRELGGADASRGLAPVWPYWSKTSSGANAGRPRGGRDH